ncbi:twin-arginine translocase TatA/TatE family subunit [Ornithinimicrobium sp. F0845]|uniref:twin-arginine translocase TatA/TatE family subunit n=1 Tax=Ornithinimicrobium sp. F0845 TaxID=2926412 RepID=UPI001FF594D9|nr:twin-arginine translocase TatA/TatE family subunit [Ornithinimicrobium sp. F0845]MCK0113232.1 twin-arginine translocase TatA/TatE family subunit [Ornithinimicrobium sp. F0845]
MRPQPWHIIVLVIALIILFGWKSLPNMARSLGQSMRIFKSEVDQMKGPSAASQDTVRGERADGESGGLRDRAADLGDRARDTAEGVKDHGASVRDEFRDGLRGEDVPADDSRRDDTRG